MPSPAPALDAAHCPLPTPAAHTLAVDPALATAAGATLRACCFVVWLTRTACQKSQSSDGDNLIYGVSSMQGWRISMEDAHACVLDLQPLDDEGKPTPDDKKLSFFGVYDGHGGDKVAIYTGEHLHEIVSKQEAFKEGDIKKALQDGFLATDRAILSGMFGHHPLLS